ncbi:MAG: hypothetical protein ABI721_00240 [Candidatus Dojkabacteria bacterium]
MNSAIAKAIAGQDTLVTPARFDNNQQKDRMRNKNGADGRGLVQKYGINPTDLAALEAYVDGNLQQVQIIDQDANTMEADRLNQSSGGEQWLRKHKITKFIGKFGKFIAPQIAGMGVRAAFGTVGATGGPLVAGAIGGLTGGLKAAVDITLAGRNNTDIVEFFGKNVNVAGVFEQQNRDKWKVDKLARGWFNWGKNWALEPVYKYQEREDRILNFLSDKRLDFSREGYFRDPMTVFPVMKNLPLSDIQLFLKDLYIQGTLLSAVGSRKDLTPEVRRIIQNWIDSFCELQLMLNAILLNRGLPLTQIEGIRTDATKEITSFRSAKGEAAYALRRGTTNAIQSAVYNVAFQTLVTGVQKLVTHYQGLVTINRELVPINNNVDAMRAANPRLDQIDQQVQNLQTQLQQTNVAGGVTNVTNQVVQNVAGTARDRALSLFGADYLNNAGMGEMGRWARVAAIQTFQNQYTPQVENLIGTLSRNTHLSRDDILAWIMNRGSIDGAYQVVGGASIVNLNVTDLLTRAINGQYNVASIIQGANANVDARWLDLMKNGMGQIINQVTTTNVAGAGLTDAARANIFEQIARLLAEKALIGENIGGAELQRAVAAMDPNILRQISEGSVNVLDYLIDTGLIVAGGAIGFIGVAGSWAAESGELGTRRTVEVRRNIPNPNTPMPPPVGPNGRPYPQPNAQRAAVYNATPYPQQAANQQPGLAPVPQGGLGSGVPVSSDETLHGVRALDDASAQTVPSDFFANTRQNTSTQPILNNAVPQQNQPVDQNNLVAKINQIMTENYDLPRIINEIINNPRTITLDAVIHNDNISRLFDKALISNLGIKEKVYYLGNDGLKKEKDIMKLIIINDQYNDIVKDLDAWGLSKDQIILRRIVNKPGGGEEEVFYNMKINNRNYTIEEITDSGVEVGGIQYGTPKVTDLGIGFNLLSQIEETQKSTSVGENQVENKDEDIIARFNIPDYPTGASQGYPESIAGKEAIINKNYKEEYKLQPYDGEVEKYPLFDNDYNEFDGIMLHRFEIEGQKFDLFITKEGAIWYFDKDNNFMRLENPANVGGTITLDNGEAYEIKLDANHNVRVKKNEVVAAPDVIGEKIIVDGDEVIINSSENLRLLGSGNSSIPLESFAIKDGKGKIEEDSRLLVINNQKYVFRDGKIYEINGTEVVEDQDGTITIESSKERDVKVKLSNGKIEVYEIIKGDLKLPKLERREFQANSVETKKLSSEERLQSLNDQLKDKKITIENKNESAITISDLELTPDEKALLQGRLSLWYDRIQEINPLILTGPYDKTFNFQEYGNGESIAAAIVESGFEGNNNSLNLVDFINNPDKLDIADVERALINKFGWKEEKQAENRVEIMLYVYHLVHAVEGALGGYFGVYNQLEALDGKDIKIDIQNDSGANAIRFVGKDNIKELTPENKAFIGGRITKLFDISRKLNPDISPEDHQTLHYDFSNDGNRMLNAIRKIVSKENAGPISLFNLLNEIEIIDFGELFPTLFMEGWKDDNMNDNRAAVGLMLWHLANAIEGQLSDNEVKGEDKILDVDTEIKKDKEFVVRLISSIKDVTPKSTSEERLFPMVFEAIGYNTGNRDNPDLLVTAIIMDSIEHYALPGLVNRIIDLMDIDDVDRESVRLGIYTFIEEKLLTNDIAVVHKDDAKTALIGLESRKTLETLDIALSVEEISKLNKESNEDEQTNNLEVNKFPESMELNKAYETLIQWDRNPLKVEIPVTNEQGVSFQISFNHKELVPALNAEGRIMHREFNVKNSQNVKDYPTESGEYTLIYSFSKVKTSGEGIESLLIEYKVLKKETPDSKNIDKVKLLRTIEEKEKNLGELQEQLQSNLISRELYNVKRRDLMFKVGNDWLLVGLKRWHLHHPEKAGTKDEWEIINPYQRYQLERPIIKTKDINEPDFLASLSEGNDQVIRNLDAEKIIGELKPGRQFESDDNIFTVIEITPNGVFRTKRQSRKGGIEVSLNFARENLLEYFTEGRLRTIENINVNENKKKVDEIVISLEKNKELIERLTINDRFRRKTTNTTYTIEDNDGDSLVVIESTARTETPMFLRKSILLEWLLNDDVEMLEPEDNSEYEKTVENLKKGDEFTYNGNKYVVLPSISGYRGIVGGNIDKRSDVKRFPSGTFMRFLKEGVVKIESTNEEITQQVAKGVKEAQRSPTAILKEIADTYEDL